MQTIGISMISFFKIKRNGGIEIHIAHIGRIVIIPEFRGIYPCGRTSVASVIPFAVEHNIGIKSIVQILLAVGIRNRRNVFLSRKPVR